MGVFHKQELSSRALSKASSESQSLVPAHVLDDKSRELRQMPSTYTAPPVPA